MVVLTGIFHRLQSPKVLVIGDLMLDVYTEGNVDRISPEAPVSVLHVKSEEDRPGGAGNVTLNLQSLGCTAIPVGLIGKDKEGDRLIRVLQEKGIDTSGIIQDTKSKTIIKNRLIANNQQLIRLDYEETLFLSEQTEERILNFIKKQLDSISIIAISDYGKGFLTDSLLETTIQLANEKGIPTLIDPKGKDFSKYKGCTVLKPNFSEAVIASKRTSAEAIEIIAQDLLDETACDYLLITRSSEGMSLFHQDGLHTRFSVPPRSVRDVTGAGDTVLATLCLGMGSQLLLEESIDLANLAAGIAIERFGCALITLKDLATRLLGVDCVNKVFDDHHLDPLKLILDETPFSILSVQITKRLSTQLYGLIRGLRKDYPGKCLVYLNGGSPEDDLVHLLASLKEIDFIILKKENLAILLETLEPNNVFAFSENETFTRLDHPKNLLTLH